MILLSICCKYCMKLILCRNMSHMKKSVPYKVQIKHSILLFLFILSTKFEYIKKCNGMGKNILTCCWKTFILPGGKKTKYFQIVLDNCMNIRG